jgi:hypothetical protein
VVIFDHGIRHVVFLQHIQALYRPPPPPPDGHR